MPLDTNILFKSRGTQPFQSINNGLISADANTERGYRNDLLEQSLQDGEQRIEQDGMNLDAQRQKQEAVNALTTMADLEQFMSAGDLGGGIAQLDQAMKAGKIDQQDFRVLAQSIQNPELYGKVKQAAMEKARVLGIGTGDSGISEFQRQNIDLQRRRLDLQEKITAPQKARLDIQEDRVDLQRQKDLREQEKFEAERAEAERKKASASQAARQRSVLVSQDIERAKDLASGLTTGFLGARTQGIEGTDSFNLAQVLDGIKANIGFKELNDMRQNSPTGGALGNVTERELALLQRVVGSLEQAQGKDQFLSNLNRTQVLFDAIVNGSTAIPFSDEDYSLMPSGATFIDPDDGKLYRKP
jgi:hypothetical protein